MEENTPNIANLSLEQKVDILEQDLPAPIRSFLHSTERDAVSLRLTQKYALHADQAGAFEQAYLYMLLGVNTPEDFVQDLQQAGIGEETIRGLTNDINEFVFKRLQQQELSASEAPKTAYRNAPEQPAVPLPHIAPTPPPIPAPEPVIPFVVPAPIQAETPPYNLIRPDVLVAAPRPILHTMQADMEALMHPQMPRTLGPTSTPATLHPTQLTPARSFQTASVPYSPPMPAPPLHIQAMPVPPSLPIQGFVPPSVHSVAPSATISAPGGLQEAPKEYGADPYREAF